MRAYEIMVIFDKDAKEDERQAILDGFQNGIKEIGGEITLMDDWGMRDFAYEIDHKFEGHYVVQEFTAQGDLSELERPMRLSDAVVRQKIMLIPDEEIERRNELRSTGTSTYAIPRPSKKDKRNEREDAKNDDRNGAKSDDKADAKIDDKPGAKSDITDAAIDEKSDENNNVTTEEAAKKEVDSKEPVEAPDLSEVVDEIQISTGK